MANEARRVWLFKAGFLVPYSLGFYRLLFVRHYPSKMNMPAKALLALLYTSTV
jgi:hypothetical protein